MRTSFDHQPEAQHPKIFSYPQPPADYPIFPWKTGSDRPAVKPARMTQLRH
jgi:hypothetical protein